MKTKQINIYSFNELETETQKKVIDYFRQKETFFYDGVLNDELNEILQNELQRLNIEYSNLNLSYSLSYCQGDGVNFTGDFKFKGINFYIRKSSHHYEHYKTVSISSELEEENETLNDYVLNEIENEFNELFKQICFTIEKAGYKEIEYFSSDEYIKNELLQNDGFKFFENGDLIPSFLND